MVSSTLVQPKTSAQVAEEAELAAAQARSAAQARHKKELAQIDQKLTTERARLNRLREVLRRDRRQLASLDWKKRQEIKELNNVRNNVKRQAKSLELDADLTAVDELWANTRDLLEIDLQNLSNLTYQVDEGKDAYDALMAKVDANPNSLSVQDEYQLLNIDNTWEEGKKIIDANLERVNTGWLKLHKIQEKLSTRAQRRARIRKKIRDLEEESKQRNDNIASHEKDILKVENGIAASAAMEAQFLQNIRGLREKRSATIDEHVLTESLHKLSAPC